mgnify:CR=1 FL=1
MGSHRRFCRKWMNFTSAGRIGSLENHDITPPQSSFTEVKRGNGWHESDEGDVGHTMKCRLPRIFLKTITLPVDQIPGPGPRIPSGPPPGKEASEREQRKLQVLKGKCGELGGFSWNVKAVT